MSTVLGAYQAKKFLEKRDKAESELNTLKIKLAQEKERNDKLFDLVSEIALSKGLPIVQP